MTKLPAQPLVSERANQTILSGSRTLDGVSANATTIPTIDTAADRRSDSVGVFADPPPIAPPAQTSRRGFLMNTMVSATALATATAVGTPSIANAALISGEVSFPALVDRFVRIRERQYAQEKKDKAWADKIDRLMSEATDLSREELDQVFRHDPNDLRRADIDAINKRIVDQNPHEDEHWGGINIAWSEISDELNSVAKAMLRRKPQSIADLAWQAEAVLTADDELCEENEEHPLLPRLIENIRSLAGPLSIPSIVPAADTVDPIFAAIEAHRTALADLSDAVQIECDLERTLSRDKRRSSLTAWEEKIVETDDPRWMVAVRSRSDDSNAADDVAMALFDIKPTTVAGASALLKYVAAEDDLTFPDNLVDDDGKNISFGSAIAGHVGDVLSGIRQLA